MTNRWYEKNEHLANLLERSFAKTEREELLKEIERLNKLLEEKESKENKED